jgi:hypothetical protein
MAWIKVIYKNIVLTLALLFLLMLVPPIAYNTYSLFKSDASLTFKDARSDLNLYEGYEWAEAHFKSLRGLSTTYYDYITLRRDDLKSDTINIVNGVRNTSIPVETNLQGEVWFFGGSTTWGSGNDDNHTYPSIFAHKYSSITKNFGETGYIARQSLSYLQNLYIKNKGGDNTIAFYDGVNDVAMRCRSEIDGLGTGQQTLIRNRLKNNSETKHSFRRTFSQLIGLASTIKARMSLASNLDNVAKFYDCNTNQRKSHFIAKTLVNTWVQAQKTATANGDKFVAILQPVAFWSDPNVDYLDLQDDNSRGLRKQYEAVYPLIIKYASEAEVNFLDMTKVYDGCSNCYIDFCHVGPQGHELLVNALHRIL